MIIYTVLKDSNETNYKKIVDDEIIMLGKYLSSQREIKKSIASYKKKISKIDNSAQKQTLLSLLDTASLQIEMVTEDLNTLNTILIESPELTKKDVDEYNRLLKNVEKNITLVNDMFQRVVTSWESIAGSSVEPEEAVSAKTTSKTNTVTEDTTTPTEKAKTKSTKAKTTTTSSNKRLEVMQKEMAKVAKAEKLAKEKEQKEIAKAKKLAKEEKERLEREKLEKERLEKERLEKERLEQERIEREKIAEEAKKNIEAKLKEALVPVIEDEVPESEIKSEIKEVAKNVTPTTTSTNVTRLNPETIDTTETLKKQIMASKFIAMSQNSYPENIKPVSTDTPSSDLICNFPKSEDDILSITTVQNEYSISFNKSDVTVSIEKEKFNITLKTIGVQFSNGNKVLSISRAPLGYFLSTNLIMDLPDYLNVAKVDIKNKFVNLNLLNPELNISVNNSQLTFSQNPTATTETQGTVVPTTPTATIPQVSTPIALIKTSKQPEKEIVPTTPVVPAPTPVQEDVVLPESADTFVNDNEEPFDPKGNLLRDNNTLIISEDDDHIVLPYKLSDAEKEFKNSKKKYFSVEDYIENEYILPMSAFRNPITSRFREAFQLMKKKENGNFKEAIDLGFELMFQFDLNPAIIAACKNLEELDIYLDCLDDNEVDKFDCFNIEYRTPPSTKKKKK